ncbi:MAG: hypothetical protein V7636_1588 [Actinomycetota bacterium]|jgi:hypothetical protein
MRVASWKLLLAAAIVTAAVLTVVGPDHAGLQMAADADAFRAKLTHPGRELAAALIDVGFAASYGLLGIVGYRMTTFRSSIKRFAIALVALGALCDEIENMFLVRNITERRTLSDGWVDAMKVPGTLKWIGSPALLVLMVWAIGRAVRRARAVR